MGVRIPSGVQGQRMHAFDLTEEVSVTDVYFYPWALGRKLVCKIGAF